MHLRSLSNLLCSCIKRTVQWQQWMQQGKSCSPNDAKPSTHISPQTTKVAISIRLGWTKDNHGSHYGQHFVRLRTRTTSRCTVASNKTVKQDASVQLPTSHVLPYATLEETAMQTSLMTAFESSSRFCVSCCNFASVQVRNLLSPVGTLDCDFWIDRLQIFRGFH